MAPCLQPAMETCGRIVTGAAETPLPATQRLPFSVGDERGREAICGRGAGGFCSCPAARSAGRGVRQRRGSGTSRGYWVRLRGRPCAAGYKGKIKFQLKARVRFWGEKQSRLFYDSRHNIISGQNSTPHPPPTKLLILVAFSAVFLQRKNTPHWPAILAATQRRFSCQKNCVSIFDGNF